MVEKEHGLNRRDVLKTASLSIVGIGAVSSAEGATSAGKHADGEVLRDLTQPTVRGGELLYGNGQSFHATNLNGEGDAKVELTGGYVQGTADTIGNRYVVATYQSVFAVRPDMNGSAWSHSVDGGIVDVTATSKRIFVTTGQRLKTSPDEESSAKVVCLDASGDEQWTYELENSARAAASLDEETLYVTDYEGKVYALGTDGSEQWTANVSAPLEVTPAVRSRFVVVTDRSGTVTAFDDQTGETVWEQQIGDPVQASPKTRGNKVFVPTEDGLTALDLRDGAQFWSRDTDAAVSAVTTERSASVFATESGKIVQFVPSSGETVAASQLQEGYRHGTYYAKGIVGEPVIHDGTVYAAGEFGQIDQTNVANGGA